MYGSPVMDGLTATRQMRSGKQQESGDPHRSHDLHNLLRGSGTMPGGGMNEYLSKPINVQEAVAPHLALGRQHSNAKETAC